MKNNVPTLFRAQAPACPRGSIITPISLVIATLITMASLVGCGVRLRAEDITTLKSDTASQQSEIKAAPVDDSRYAGGNIKSLIASRMAILRQREASLQHKSKANTLDLALKYAVDGRPFVPPDSTNDLLRTIEQNIADSLNKITRQEAETARYGIPPLVPFLRLTAPGMIQTQQAQFIPQGGPLTYMNGGVAISADGNTAIVGDFGHNNFTGGALIFTRTNGIWSQQGSELTGSGAVPSQGFVSQGSAVALSADGNTALVGGPFDGGDNRGAVWVFTRSNGQWSQQGSKLVGNGAVSGSMQGDVVALSADGNTALIGNGSAADGAYIFTRSNGVWSQQGGKLTGALSGCFDAVALSADGNTALVGDFCDGSVGATRVFTRSSGVWTQQARLVGTGSIGDSFQGRDVALSSDGNTALVGAYADNNDAGAVWAFTRSNGLWSQQGGKLNVTDAVGPSPAEFGHSVALSGDGNTALIVGPADSNYVGATWVFSRGNGVWGEQSKLVVSNAGSSAAISADGSTAILADIQAFVYVQAIGPPAAPVLLSPVNGATQIPVTTCLAWNAGSGAASYDVYFGTGAPLPLVTNTTSTTYCPASSLGNGTIYNWYVVAKNSAGTMASPTFSFITLPFIPLGQPTVVLDSPVAMAVVSGTVVLRGWALDNAAGVGTAISSVQVQVDGTIVGAATRTNRADVCNVYPNRVDCPNVGFSFQWNTASVSNGSHTQCVVATDSDPSPDSGTACVNVIINNSVPSARTNLTVWRSSNGTWYVNPASTASFAKQWGLPSDIPAAADFDGDGNLDYAIWRPAEGNWYVTLFTGTVLPVKQWGLPGDIPVPGDYDGDGKTDYAVWRPSTGTWYIAYSSNGAQVSKQWGLPSDIPIVADFDGDGKVDYAIWRPVEGNWYITLSSTGQTLVKQWGLNGDKPVAADFDGDGKADYAIWRPVEGNWYITLSGTGAQVVKSWGLLGDIPVPRDFDGDGKADYAVWRPSNGTWYIVPSSNPAAPLVVQWGLSGDMPIYKPAGN